MYPEVDPENSVTLAPGEGKYPKNVLLDNDWDINSADGKYGLHFKREKKLPYQYFFIQRICNVNEKFAISPAYMYMLLLHIQN